MAPTAAVHRRTALAAPPAAGPRRCPPSMRLQKKLNLVFVAGYQRCCVSSVLEATAGFVLNASPVIRDRCIVT